jgi:hypothetical protein
MSRKASPCTFLKACHVIWIIGQGCTQTQAANAVGINQGTVCHIVHGRRFPGAYAIPIPRAA